MSKVNEKYIFDIFEKEVGFRPERTTNNHIFEDSWICFKVGNHIWEMHATDFCHHLVFTCPGEDLNPIFATMLLNFYYLKEFGKPWDENARWVNNIHMGGGKSIGLVGGYMI